MCRFILSVSVVVVVVVCHAASSHRAAGGGRSRGRGKPQEAELTVKRILRTCKINAVKQPNVEVLLVLLGKRPHQSYRISCFLPTPTPKTIP